ncbi:cupin domain-containing protein [Cellulomonas soli]|nr:cupin domain-containing protein [Cellulomonas soli]NYI59319.1 quercetin dioxygenase-like cupin family protein [Cellulomonas soli]
MRLYELPRGEITAFGSSGVVMDFLPRAQDGNETRVSIAYIRRGGTLGMHPATLRQVFCVLTGAGETQISGGPRRALRPGMLVVWEPGELHQTWATTDLTAVVVETNGSLDLDEHYREL